MEVGDPEVTCGGSPNLSCKRDQIKMRDYMDRRVTPPKRSTSPTWGTPPSCKQALSWKYLLRLLTIMQGLLYIAAYNFTQIVNMNSLKFMHIKRMGLNKNLASWTVCDLGERPVSIVTVVPTSIQTMILIHVIRNNSPNNSLDFTRRRIKGLQGNQS